MRARLPFRARAAHARREPSGGVVAASDCATASSARVLAAAFLGGEWELDATGARGRGARWAGARGCGRVALEVLARLPPAAAGPPARAGRLRRRSSSTSCRGAARRRACCASRSFHPDDGLRALAGAADRHGRRPGGVPGARSRRARVVRRRARARAGGRATSGCATTATRSVPRASGPPRVLEAPKPRLKALQRRLLHEMLDFDPGPRRPRTGSWAGARRARTPPRTSGGAWSCGVDLEDFFAGVTAARVFGIFRACGLPGGRRARADRPVHERRAGRASPCRATGGSRAGSATPHLPQGAPTSPALANLAAFALDRRLTGLAARDRRDLHALRRRPRVLQRRLPAHPGRRDRRDRRRRGLPRQRRARRA